MVKEGKCSVCGQDIFYDVDLNAWLHVSMVADRNHDAERGN